MKRKRSSTHLRRRILAAIADWLILAGVEMVLLVIFGTKSEETYTLTGYKALASMLLPWFIYFPLAEAITGQTLGKSAFRLEVVRLDGHKLTLADTIKRHLCDSCEIGFFGLAGIMVIRRSPLNQRLGDQFAKTTVVADTEILCPSCGAENILQGSAVLTGTFRCYQCGYITDTPDRDSPTYHPPMLRRKASDNR